MANAFAEIAAGVRRKTSELTHTALSSTRVRQVAAFGESVLLTGIPVGIIPQDAYASSLLRNPIEQSQRGQDVVVGNFETVVGKDGITQITRVNGETYSPDDSLSVLAIPFGFSPQEGLQAVKRYTQYLSEVKPLNDYLSEKIMPDGTKISPKIAVWARNVEGTENIGCFNVGEVNLDCNTQAVVDVIKQTNATTGIIMQKAVVLWKNTTDHHVKELSLGNPNNLPQSVENFSMVGLPDVIQNSLEIGGFAHGFGILLGLGDEWYWGGNQSVGNIYPNCTTEPVWVNMNFPGNPGLKYKGCHNDPNAYKTGENYNGDTSNSNVMVDAYTKDFGPFNTLYIDRYFNQNPGQAVYSAQMPKTAIGSEGVISVQAQKEKVTVNSPDMNIFANMTFPLGTTQVKIEVVPPDGPAYTMIFGDGAFIKSLGQNGLKIQAPQMGVGPYIVLPDMTYRLRTWTANATTSLGWEAKEWEQYSPYPFRTAENPPAEMYIHTPKRDATKITPAALGGGETTNALNPKIQWQNGDGDVFYYEVQLSADATFNTDPKTAVAAVYTNLIHAGETNPMNSWQVPSEYPLEGGKRYFWRVRPRVQGDGTPVAWTNPFSFSTEAGATPRTTSAEPDKDYGNGVTGASQRQLEEFGPLQKLTSEPVEVIKNDMVEVSMVSNSDGSATYIQQPGYARKAEIELQAMTRILSDLESAKVTIEPDDVRVMLAANREAVLPVNRETRRREAKERLKAFAAA